MASYSFVTHWRFRAPIERVFDAISRAEEWPRWWPGVLHARRQSEGDPSGCGKCIDFTFKGSLPYTLRFTMTYTNVEPPTAIDGEAVGELQGSGRWRLQRDGEETLVTYYWDVRTTNRLMNLLAPIARPVFRWNHDRVMRAGGEGLARWLARAGAENPEATR